MASSPSSLQVFGLRLGPGSDLLKSLQDFVVQAGLRAPFVVSCVGSLTSARLRLANATATNTNEVLELSGRFEIVSLVGTLNPEAHLHLCLSDSEGRCVGGHVLGNLSVFTTAEVVLGEALDLSFSREMDPQTGFPELVVEKRDRD
ncbi:hypothetical protein WMY93_033979 [Mugilogobius chulae]|uniref:PPC domain-containing protein n=1 Tax=Mugilogobius chulae TaxID=88201 RepID=A0AAW0MH81_9GOBI